MFAHKCQQRNACQCSHRQIFFPFSGKPRRRNQDRQQAQRHITSTLTVQQKQCHHFQQQHALAGHLLFLVDGLQTETSVEQQDSMGDRIMGKGCTLLHVHRKDCQYK